MLDGARGGVKALRMRLPRLAALVSVVLLLSGCAGHAASQPAPGAEGAGLRAPFDVAARRALMGRAERAPACPPAPPPQRDVIGVSFYTDARFSVPDPARVQANNDATRPLRDFNQQVAQWSDIWVRSNPPRPEAARCALAWMAAWAAGGEPDGAMLGRTNNQGAYERKWTLAGLALAYLKIREAPALDPAERRAVLGWFRRLAAAVRPPYERAARPGTISSAANNHAYWSGLAVGAAAIALDDRALFEWAMERARVGLRQVTAEGALPLEMARGAKALHYHLFALTPLAFLAAMGEANGVDLHAENGGALMRLAALTQAGLADRGRFAALAGAEQDAAAVPERLGGLDLAWAEILLARAPDPRLAAWTAARRPLRHRWIGGDATLLFGPVPAPRPTP
ncbi:MAG: alginate lyase family protein [Alphaproteobacteria bacterium]|nr:alginate lyase family protein [Alphaproteobacteria bacterium]